MPFSRRNQDRQQKLIDSIVDSNSDYQPLKDRRQWRRFINEYYRNVSVDDTTPADAPMLARAALCHLRAAKRLSDDGDYHLRIYNPDNDTHDWESNDTIIELVHRNMPFLVDSLGMALDRLGYAAQLTIHPLLRIERTKAGNFRRLHPRESDEGHIESFIRFHVRRETREEQLATLEETLRSTLKDVALAVNDWQAMREKMQAAVNDARQHEGTPRTLRQESVALLDWLLDDMFTFLGYREYRLEDKDGETELAPVARSALGIVRRHRGKRQPLNKAMRRFRRADDLLLLTKVNTRATVHRASYLDYVGVKMFDEDGHVIGERRFIGLMTSQAYSTPPDEIPLVRGKIREIIKRAGLDPTGHRGKALIHILNNFPRDELFQASVSDLLRTTTGILNLQDRRRVKFFIRRDSFRRFYSCLVYVPREKYNTEVRQRIEQILSESLGANNIESSVQLSDSALARVHMLVYAPSDQSKRVSIRAIENAISAAVVTWRDRLQEALLDTHRQGTGADLFERYGRIFPLAYEEDETPQQGCRDIAQIDAMLNDSAEPLSELQLLVRQRDDGEQEVCFRVYRLGQPIGLSDALPLLENLGVRVTSERPYQLRMPGKSGWIQDFELALPDGLDAGRLKKSARAFAEGFADQVSGKVESDGYNQLILAAGLESREVTLLRAYAKYLLQLGLPFSQSYLEEILCRHANFSEAVYAWFVACHKPNNRAGQKKQEKLLGKVKKAIGSASNLDADRALRALFSVMQATVRCNFFWRDENGNVADAIAFKLETDRIDEAPLPRPQHEIFVYSPRVEGVHLRAGDVARGGLRWSDRREDFRTEVLGLMKAQTVKNTVIVPTGAKGGFYPKQLPEGDRDAVMEEVTACYKTFVAALLSVTDNLKDGKIVPPDQVRRLDGDDPYLVVAADKGTATFSDTANKIAVDRDFWLGDAFASGGSAGYDHKKMAITARGAWEAVKRHFREIGTDTQSDKFTVAGIGDMSGDVFGNGMLLSKTIRLQAAFNHQHIFIDPDPDPETSFAERKRLFEMSRSGWGDYDKDCISEGGGVFSRADKSIPLSEPMRRLLKTDAEELSAPELIRLILKMPVDLLWNGGIGTYVKASSESTSDVGDRSNDNLRVDADELRCKVIGEGGNLGLTQRARVEYGLNGGRLNTDFIDNSAGVDSSDREVNIKILLSDVMQRRKFDLKARNKLLAEMTDEVAELVLRNNYLQTQAISMMEASAAERISEHREVIAALERSGLLNRRLEAMPDDETLDERKRAEQGLTRPELAVVLSYAKLDLYQRLEETKDALNERELSELVEYFPTPLRKRFVEEIHEHKLGHEITNTLLTNSIVNRMGPIFAIRAELDTGFPATAIAESYVVARGVTDARSLWADIESMDTRIPTNIQYAMMFEVARKLRHACYWLLKTHDGELDSSALIDEFSEPLQQILGNLTDFLTESGKRYFARLAKQHERMGVPSHLAKRVSALSFVNDVLEIVRLASQRNCKPAVIASVYFSIGKRLQLDWVRQSIDKLSVDGRWQARARATLRDNVSKAQRELTARVHSLNECRAAEESIDEMIEQDATSFERTNQLIDQMRDKGSNDFATLTVAVDELTQLTR